MLIKQIIIDRIQTKLTTWTKDILDGNSRFNPICRRSGRSSVDEEGAQKGTSNLIESHLQTDKHIRSKKTKRNLEAMNAYVLDEACHCNAPQWNFSPN